jgi:hypothetical protein
MRPSRYFLPLPLAATLLAATGVARAATFEYGSYSVVNEQVISIATPNNVMGGTGAIVLNGAGANAGQSLLAWCLDIYTYLVNPSPSSTTYNLGTLTNAGSGGLNPTLTNTQIGEIGALMFNGQRLISSSPNASAATQLAIWEVEYGSKLTFSGLPSDTVTLAGQYVGDVAGGGWGPVGPVGLLSAPGNQSLGLVPTPLPATWSMLLAVLAGLGLWSVKDRARRSFAF